MYKYIFCTVHGLGPVCLNANKVAIHALYNNQFMTSFEKGMTQGYLAKVFNNLFTYKYGFNMVIRLLSSVFIEQANSVMFYVKIQIVYKDIEFFEVIFTNINTNFKYTYPEYRETEEIKEAITNEIAYRLINFLKAKVGHKRLKITLKDINYLPKINLYENYTEENIAEYINKSDNHIYDTTHNQNSVPTIQSSSNVNSKTSGSKASLVDCSKNVQTVKQKHIAELGHIDSKTVKSDIPCNNNEIMHDGPSASNVKGTIKDTKGIIQDSKTPIIQNKAHQQTDLEGKIAQNIHDSLTSRPQNNVSKSSNKMDKAVQGSETKQVLDKQTSVDSQKTHPQTVPVGNKTNISNAKDVGGIKQALNDSKDEQYKELNARINPKFAESMGQNGGQTSESITHTNSEDLDGDGQVDAFDDIQESIDEARDEASKAVDNAANNVKDGIVHAEAVVEGISERVDEKVDALKEVANNLVKLKEQVFESKETAMEYGQTLSKKVPKLKTGLSESVQGVKKKLGKNISNFKESMKEYWDENVNQALTIEEPDSKK